MSDYQKNDDGMPDLPATNDDAVKGGGIIVHEARPAEPPDGRRGQTVPPAAPPE